MWAVSTTFWWVQGRMCALPQLLLLVVNGAWPMAASHCFLFCVPSPHCVCLQSSCTSFFLKQCELLERNIIYYIEKEIMLSWHKPQATAQRSPPGSIDTCLPTTHGLHYLMAPSKQRTDGNEPGGVRHCSKCRHYRKDGDGINSHHLSSAFHVPGTAIMPALLQQCFT